MWLLEIFPQFKNSSEWFQGETIPRFLGWKKGKKFMTSTVDGLLQLAATKREFRPSLVILPTENELRSEWYVSSSDYLDAERRLYASAMSGENPVQMATEIPVQMPTGFTGQIHPEMQAATGVGTQEQMASLMNTLFGDDDANQGYNPAPNQHEIPQQNFVPPTSTFQSNYENELISQFKSLMDERLIENNRRLTDMVMSQFAQTYRWSPKQKTVRTPTTVQTPKEQAHTQSDNVMCFVVADSFINYDNANNAYHVSMSPMENVFLLLSPYVAFKRVKDKQAKKLRNEDRQIEYIKEWYPDSGSKHLSLLMGNSVGPNFWGSLLGVEKQGWLNDDVSNGVCI
ncbi:hypothetical protein Hanom_Chr01g00077091 [Helianthus anomalus]